VGCFVAALALAHVRPVPPAELSTHWIAPPAVVVLAALAAALYVQATIRLRRRGRADLAGWGRAFLFAAGLALVVLPLVSPLDGVADRYLLSAHMLQHVLIADAGPALLVLAVRGPLGFFLVPAPLLRRLAALRPLLRVLVRPDVAFLVWVATILGWHFPSAYDYTLLHPWAHELEHATFVLAGTLAWIQVVDPARRRHLTRGGRALVAFGMLAFGTAIVDGLLFSPAPAYAVYAAQPHRVFGLSALLDQRLGAVVMFAEQALTVGIALVVLLRPSLRAAPSDAVSSVARLCHPPPRRRRRWAFASSAAARSPRSSSRSAR
jgi:cytochrome c oxidase assembly factor CtaG